MKYATDSFGYTMYFSSFPFPNCCQYDANCANNVNGYYVVLKNFVLNY